MGIKPIESLIFAIQSNPGTYALLLGSGISRAANIPTGWEITEDLIQRLAVLRKEKCEPDPETWYCEKFGKEPNYSKLLEELTKTKTERQQLLRSYFEPNSANNEGDKRPTKAHKAIASLVAKGFIKVIITTNFDRLLENALDELGIKPTVISTPDQINGALPLTQNKNCQILKIHGDYQDSRIRNTPSELEKYPDKFNKMLGQIFDEYGLIVCGWSAEWDTALCKALSRTKTKRFTTYWGIHGELKEQASKLIELRDAQKIEIKDADTFFQEIADGVDAIEKYSKPHPLSTELAVANLKRYLSKPEFDIQLGELVDEIVDKIVEAISGENFNVKPKNLEDPTTRVRKYEALCSTLLSMAPIGAFYARKEHWLIWQKTLRRLYKNSDSGNAYLIDLQRYPGTLLLYSLGIGAIANEKYDFLNYLLMTKIHKSIYEDDVSAINLFPPFFYNWRGEIGNLLEGMPGHLMPINEWLYKTLRPYVNQLISDDNHYLFVFNKLEILISLIFTNHNYYQDNNYHGIPGMFLYKKQYINKVVSEINDSINTYKDDSQFIKSKIFAYRNAAAGEGTRPHDLFSFEKYTEKARMEWGLYD